MRGSGQRAIRADPHGALYNHGATDGRCADDGGGDPSLREVPGGGGSPQIPQGASLSTLAAIRRRPRSARADLGRSAAAAACPAPRSGRIRATHPDPCRTLRGRAHRGRGRHRCRSRPVRQRIDPVIASAAEIASWAEHCHCQIRPLPQVGAVAIARPAAVADSAEHVFPGLVAAIFQMCPADRPGIPARSAGRTASPAPNRPEGIRFTSSKVAATFGLCDGCISRMAFCSALGSLLPVIFNRPGVPARHRRVIGRTSATPLRDL